MLKLFVTQLLGDLKLSKKKFNDIWSNQTNLGKRFGISAIQVGEILIKHGLKSAKTKEATKKALDSGYAKSTPLKDGTPYYMWNIQMIQSLLKESYEMLSEVGYWVNEVKTIFQEADRLTEEGQDKLACFIADSAYDEVPKKIRKEVKKIVENFFNDV